nr:CHAD domain-containing protein [uncultured Desulfuromonas sp.]
MTPLLSWHVKEPLTHDRISCLLAPYTVECVDDRDMQWSVLDDPAWHIWQDGSILLYAHHQPSLQLWRENAVQLSDTKVSPQARFPHHLHNKPLTERLKALLGVRAFTEKQRISWRHTVLAVRNDDRKIVCRLTLIQRPETTLLSLHPLRGYQQETEAICRQLSSLDMQPCALLTMRQILLYSGLQVVVPPKQLTFNLKPTQAGQRAILHMIERLVSVARQQEQGLCDDIDTEYIHQYRVALRKARSLVSLFKTCLPKDARNALKQQLKQLAQRSNRLRDLDVFLLDRDHYTSLLPTALRPGLDDAFQRIQRRRNREQKQLAALLLSADYQDEVQQLMAAFDQAQQPLTNKGTTPIRPLAAQKIARQYRQICRDGLKIDDTTADETIHAVRIECKKLRYLLELFGELFDRKRIKRLIKELKQLQDILGRFNDLTVQQEFLSHLATTTRDTTQTISLTALVAVLYQQHVQERQRVVGAIAAFTAEDVVADIQPLTRDGDTS